MVYCQDQVTLDEVEWIAIQTSCAVNCWCIAACSKKGRILSRLVIEWHSLMSEREHRIKRGPASCLKLLRQLTTPTWSVSLWTMPMTPSFQTGNRSAEGLARNLR